MSASQIAPIHGRCLGQDIQVREIARSTYTHKCRKPAKHQGNCDCICGRSWPSKHKEN